MPAIHSQYRESGQPKIDYDKCTLCGKCSDICPAEVLSISDRKVHVNTDNHFGCIACGHCMMVCPHEAVIVSGRGISKDDLIPIPAKDFIATADQLSALMQSRRSVRHFTDQPVSQEHIDKIIDMASTGPMGVPPWDIGCVTINGTDKVQNFAQEIIKGYTGLLKIFKPWMLNFMRPFIGKARYEIFSGFILPLANIYVSSHKAGRDTLLYSAPTVMIFHHSPYVEALEATIACTYAMLAAESLGLGTTMIGGVAPVLMRNKKLCSQLGIPDANTPAIALIIGHPKVKFTKNIKRRFSTITNIN